MAVSEYSFYSRREYLEDVTSRVAAAKAGDRVALATMSFEPHSPEVQKLISALSGAAARGAHVYLAVDAYIYLAGERKGLGPLFWRRNLPAGLSGEFHAKHQVIEQLRAKGVRCTVTNSPDRILSSPVSGRSHIKYALINDRLYIGGCNISKPEQIDIMVAWEDRRSADWLYELVLQTAGSQSMRFMRGKDTEFAIDKTSSLLVDAGERRQSLILRNALDMIDQAKKSIFVTCQFFPNTVTAQRLLSAHRRGVKVTILFNHASKFPKPNAYLQHLSVAVERLRIPKQLFGGQLPLHSPYLHAKVIATEAGAIVGSHNYITAGVNFGTAEIALRRQSPEFSRQVRQAIERQITPPTAL